MFKSKAVLTLISLLAVILLMSGIGLVGYCYNHISNIPLISSHKKLKEIEKFATADDFREYLTKANELTTFGYYGGLGAFASIEKATADAMISTNETGLESESTVIAPERFSETNVQVENIDEPDIVKTDGQEIYFSPEENYWYYEGLIPEGNNNKELYTKAIKAYPVNDLALSSEIEQGGKLLLSNKTLFIFGNNKIYGFDTEDPANLQKLWTYSIDEKSSYYSARLYQGKIYLITKTNIDEFNPCPIEPLLKGDQAVKIECTDIFHPITPVPTDATYNIMIVDPVSGNIEKQMSFVGSYNNSVVYMSGSNLYITFTYPGDMVELMYSFLTEDGQGLFPDIVVAKVKKLKDYEISQEAKMMEYSAIIEGYLNSLDVDETLKLQNDLTNKLDSYLKRRRRDVERTAITKVALDNLDILATGEVAGQPLNQFSLDEYNNSLRIAVTLGEDMMFSEGSANDLYVLDENLNKQGEVLDLGEGERIYASRFIGDRGYLVTFKETDPFYVFDLSDPKNPQKVGELKINGYSSYLHPLTANLMLGIGKEQEKVKLSLFDVSNPVGPKEISKYTLDEYWTDILDTHYAFLQDEKHQAFFLPGSAGGYVFSYEDQVITLKQTIALEQVKRAIYINDYLYIIGLNKIVVLDENTWLEAKTLDI